MNTDDEQKLDSGVEAAGNRQHSQTKSSSSQSSIPYQSCSSVQSNSPHHVCSATLPDESLPDGGDTTQWESLSSGLDSEEDNLEDTLQEHYSKVMGPNGIAKLADKIPVGKFRLFCYNITRTADDYSRMGSECSRSIDVWWRVSMNCNLRYFAPLESICQQFSNRDEFKLIKDYKEALTSKEYEPILHKMKPNEGYQSISAPREKFASCIVNIAEYLDERIGDKKIRLDDMKSHFCTLKLSSVDHNQEALITNRNIQDNINKAKDVFFLLFAVSPCWDCINFLFLEEHVVKRFGGEEEKHELQGYKNYLKIRWLTHPVNEFPDMTPELTCFKDLNQVKCRINADWDATKIRHALKLKKVIASVYNVDLAAVKLFKANKGSVILHFALPSSCITELSDEKILLLGEHNFLELTVTDKAGKIINDVSYNITEKLIALDDSFQISANQPSSDNEVNTTTC